jgi:predicted phage terminase large subunit-like protein
VKTAPAPIDAQQMLDALVADRCRGRFFRFFLEFWETIESVDLVLNWHIEYLCDQLQEVYEAWERGEHQPDVLINIPPGTSKSTTVTQLFPAWLWLKCPGFRIISSSHAADLSVGHGVKTRDCLASEKFQRLFPGHITFKSDENGKTAYRNTAMGERFTTSTGSKVTGKHADGIFIDDPLDPEQASSEKSRKKAGGHLKKLASRKTDKKRSFTIMVMQRVHMLDPSGIWLNMPNKKLRHICLPGELSDEVKPVELRARYVNGLLDPTRLDRVALADQKGSLGSYGYAGQYGQTPAPEGGGKLKKTWFVGMPWAKFEELYGEEYPVWDFDLDTAYTEKQENDPNAIMSTTYIGQTLYIRGVGEKWLEMPELLAYIPEFLAMYGHTYQSRLFIEPKAAGKSTVQSLRKLTQINVVEAPSPNDSKETRVNNSAPFVEGRRVVLLYDEPNTPQGWQQVFIDQCATFPRAAHDDQVDILTQARERVDQDDEGFNLRAY